MCTDEADLNPDHRERKEQIDQIMKVLFEEHARGQALKLHIQNRAYISVETILGTAYRRMHGGLSNMDADQLDRFQADIRLGMTYLTKTMARAVWETVEKRRRQAGSSLEDIPAEHLAIEDRDLSEVLAKIALLRDLLAPHEFEILDCVDNLGLQYSELHIRNYWRRTADILKQHPHDRRLLEEALLLGSKFTPRTIEFRQARQAALAGLADCGCPFDDAVMRSYGDRYKAASAHAQKLLNRFFPTHS